MVVYGHAFHSKIRYALVNAYNIFLLGNVPKTCCGGYHFPRSLRSRMGPLPPTIIFEESIFLFLKNLYTYHPKNTTQQGLKSLPLALVSCSG